MLAQGSVSSAIDARGQAMHGLMLAFRASVLFHGSAGPKSRAGGSTCSRLAAGISRFWAGVSRLVNDLSNNEAGV